ncbi:MAG: hypothetical protein K6T51_09870 [Rubrobacteraceae bacterium]|nr:hypothetical protein [Rubrobacteraceae bacterium]
MSLRTSDREEKNVHYAETIYQLLSDVDNPARAVGRAKTSWDGSKPDFRSILRAAGAFARDNDGYFVRYENEAEREEPHPLPKATHLFVFPVPVEPRMRVAYSYMQGIFLKYLYTRYKAIPREVRQGWAEIICKQEKPLPEADELWGEFLKSEIAEDAIEVSAKNWTAGSNIGKQPVDDAFLSESYLLGLARAIAARPSAFQWQAGEQIPAFRKEDLPEHLASRKYLMTRDDPEAKKFRDTNREREWSTLDVYGWLEAKADAVPEFRELVEKSVRVVEKGKGGKVSLIPASEKLEEVFRSEFVPRSSREDWTDLAIPKITLYLLLWALVERLPEPEAGSLVFAGWSLAYLRRMRKAFDTPALRGSLKFMEKNAPSRGKVLVKYKTPFNKPKAEIRLVPGETAASSSAPFELWSFGNHRVVKPGVESGGRVCTVCGKGGDLSEARFLPESKKRPYDNPQTEKHSEVCARCVQVASLAPITTSSEDYAIVEVPVENFLELFALYESLEGISRLETLKTLNRVSSLSVFPNKYLLLSRARGKGKMPQTAQYYLQLARQPRFMERLTGDGLEVIAAQDRARLSREVALTLSVISWLPRYHASKSEEKVPAMSIINALERGRPYEALYVAASQAHESGRLEKQAIAGGVEKYDEKVIGFGEFFARRQKGASVNNKEIFRDVRTFSDYLYDILLPIVRREVDESGSSVSGVARKYTENITKSFIRVNTADFLYRISSFVEGRERQNPDKDGWIKWTTKKKVYGESGGETENESDEVPAALKLERELERYYEQYSDNERDWKTFLEEVEARTLALLLLNVANKKKG